jgi:hypothetical protein
MEIDSLGVGKFEYFNVIFLDFIKFSAMSIIINYIKIPKATQQIYVDIMGI